MRMSRGDPFFGHGVHKRAQAYEKTHRRDGSDWDDSADAVPLGKQRREERPTPPHRTVGAQNPYRVRDSLAKAAQSRTTVPPKSAPGARTSPQSQQRTPYGQMKREIPPQTDAARPKQPPRMPPRMQNERGQAEAEIRRYPPQTETTAEERGYASDEILSEDTMSDADRIAAYQRAVIKKRFVKARRVGAASAIAVVSLVCALLIVYKLFYVISDIRVEGGVTYTPEQIITESGVKIGDNLYSFSSRVTEENVTFHCPYVRTLNVDRSAPDSVLFTVTEDTAAFYADLYGELLVLSPSLRVLGTASVESARQTGLIRLYLPAVDKAIAGRSLAFRNDRVEKSIHEIVTLVLASTLSDRITAVDLREAHSLRMICDGKYVLDFGDMPDVEMQLKIAGAVMNDTLFTTDVKAQIDLSTTGATSVVLDDQIDLDW